MRYRSIIHGFLAAAVLAAGALAAQAADKVNVRYSWKLKGEYAAFYVAQEKGMFAEAGLDVTLGEGGGAQVVLSALLQGQEDIIVMPAVFALTAISRGMPIKLVALYHPAAPLGLLSFEDKPVRTPKDMEGKSLAVTVGDTTASYLPVLCRENGVDCSKISQVMMNHQVRTSQFLAREVDMMSTYLNVDLPILQKQVDGLVSLDLSDYGLTLPGLALVTSDALLESKTDVIARFVNVIGEATRSAIDDPRGATEAMMKHWPVGPEADIVQRQIEETMERVPVSDDKPLGWVDAALLEDTLEILKSVGEIEEARPINEYYTNALFMN